MTKRIEAIIREEKLTVVKNALTNIGIIGMTVTNVRGRGRGSGIQLQWRTGVYTVDLLPRVMVTVILSDENVEATVEAIKQAAYTGEKGDGVIFISPVDNIIRISTGEEGREAITYQGDIDSRKTT
jgi:nitrogen regulatory protein P-II 1